MPVAYDLIGETEMDKYTSAGASIALAIIGLAIVAVLVSNNAKTSSVLGASGKSFASAIACAVSPITGNPCGSGSLTSVDSSISYGGF